MHPTQIFTSIALAVAVFTAQLSAQTAAPKIVALSPANGDAEVDPKLTELVVTFDRRMGGGCSVCGGGPTFPKSSRRAYWKNSKTFIIPVELGPDHSYSLSLNSQSFTNFRSAKGIPLASTPWRFATLPAVLPNPKKQRKINTAAFEQLGNLIDEHYSYRDLRVGNWKTLRKQHKSKIVASKTNLGWAAAVGKMLEPTADIHMYLRFKDSTIATGRRAVDSLYRGPLLQKYLTKLDRIGNQAIRGKTDDNIGYLMIGGWTQALDLDAIEKAITEMKDTKALIIDVRPNSGGSEILARRIASWFVSGKKTYAKNRYRIGKGKNGFGPVYDREIEGNTGDKRYDGPVVVLTSRYVMSSCEAFVLMMRQADDCSVVGQSTFGSSGNPKQHALPNGVTIVIPSWQAMLPDGTCFEGTGIEPDEVVDVEPADLKNKDPILERALELLR